jgi:hypothetical protein
MSRTLSLNLREAMFSQESSEVPIFLITITHPSLDDPIHLSTDPTTRLSEDPLVYCTPSRGTDFIFAGVAITIPNEEDRSPPSSKLIIQNIDRELIPLARSISSPASAQIEVVLGSDPDTVEISLAAMDMVNLIYNQETLTWDLIIDSMVTEPYPSGKFTPASFSGLFY